MERDLKLVVSKEKIKMVFDDFLSYEVRTIDEACDILTSELSEEDTLTVVNTLFQMMKKYQ